MFDLTGKVALVTGGSRGIGRAIALGLARAGRIRRGELRIERSGRGGSRRWQITERRAAALSPYKVMSQRPTTPSASSRRRSTKLGALHILVNNAGQTADDLLLRMSEEAWDRVMAINLRGAYLCTKAALRPMVRQRWGRIINVSSVAGLVGNAGQANYAAAKAG